MNDYVHELKEEEQAQQQPTHNKKNTKNGIFLITAGVLFLMSQWGWFYFANWWALFILMPALGAASTAWNEYQTHGYMTSQARRSTIGALMIGLVASSFLFNIGFHMIWPLFLIVAGISALWEQRS